MALAPGTRLGPYEIVAPIGAGGMGEVYRARDAKLGRDVAIKVLLPSVVNDPDRLARFSREAHVLASLNHPNIAHIHGFEDSGAVHALVMELVEGPTLADRIAQGPIPLAEAVPIARQIIDALEAAHEQGIIHRDLKPANVKVRDDGTVKVLDFGLAKALDPLASSPAAAAIAQSPTLTSPMAMTQAGVILGTAAYMSPEQARGKIVDKRTDVWAFGCVLYEMVTGRVPFAGETVSDTIGKILEREPDWSALPAATPAPLRRLLLRCVEKDRKRRLADIADARLDLDEAAREPAADALAHAGGSAAGVPSPAVARRRSRERFAWTTAAALGAIAMGVAVVHLRETPSPVDPVQFTIAAEEKSTLWTSGPFAHFAISSDGRQLAFVAGSSQNPPMLWVRPLATLAARALPGTEGASIPFWSPDGRYIGFFAAGKLKKVQATGGPPMVLCDAPSGAGGTWNRNDVIVFAPSPASPLHQVDAAGGMSTPVTTLDKGETAHRWPSFLPDGQHVLYLAARGTARELRVASLGSTETASLGAAESYGLYASGHLLFSRGGTLMAQPFDPATRQRSGEPFPVAEQVPINSLGRAAFSVSATGVLGYRGGARAMRRLTWMDRTGKTLGVVGDAGAYDNLSLSPDERRIAVSMTTGSPANIDIWLIDLARADTATRLTFDPAVESDPIWSPDGSQVLFNSTRDGGRYNSAFQRSADGGGQDVPVVKMERLVDAPDWSHDGRFLVFTGDGSPTSNDLWVLPFSGERKPTGFLQTPFNEDSPAFSPDDRWIAYNSDVSGRFEVYVRSFPSGGGEFQISRNGGWAPRWRGDGNELFFLALDGTMMAADITIAKELRASVPRALFPTPLLKTTARHTYAVTKDGKRFLLVVPDPRQASTPITVVLNWPALVKK